MPGSRQLAFSEGAPGAKGTLSRGPRLLLTLLVLGVLMSVVGTALTVLANWFFRGEAGLSRDTVVRLVILGFVVATMPIGLAWARSRDGSS